jgi:hypothetical protein
MNKSFSLVTASAFPLPPVKCRIVRRVELVPAIGCLTIAQVATALRRADLVESLVDAGALEADGTPNAGYVTLGLFSEGYDIATGDRAVLVTGAGQVWIARRWKAGKLKPVASDALAIIDSALRGAVHAPSDRDALNITGEALRQLRDIARADAVPIVVDGKGRA